MVIKASSAAEIRTLVEALTGQDEVRREAAIARLAVIGPRAVDRLVASHATAAREGRIAILRALEPIADPRGLAPAGDALARGGDEASAGIGVLRALVESDHEATATEALDLLVRTALDGSAERRVRLAAFDALPETPPDVRSRVQAVLRESDPAIAPRATAGAPMEAFEAVWRDALDGRLPDRPALLRDALRAKGTTVPLSELQRLIDAVRAHEVLPPDQPPLELRRSADALAKAEGGRHSNRGTSAEWRSTRGLLHQALALRASRVALYDLRETFLAAAEPLPASFLTAVHAVGDASCLDALASALARADGRDARWRQQLIAAFQAVARRERITRRHAVMKRALAKCPALGGG